MHILYLSCSLDMRGPRESSYRPKWGRYIWLDGEAHVRGITAYVSMYLHRVERLAGFKAALGDEREREREREREFNMAEPLSHPRERWKSDGTQKSSCVCK
jgi:hypothetical protein